MDIIGERDTHGVISIREAAELFDAVYKGIATGSVVASTPSMMRIAGAPNRLGAKGAVLKDFDIAGIRLTSRAAPRLMLWSLETGEPQAFIDESFLYRFRTGVSAAVVANYLLQGRPIARVAILGAGPIARQMSIALHELLHPDEIVVASRSLKTAQAFADATSSEGAPVRAVATVREAAAGADLIITITSANEELLKPEHLSAGATVLSMGGGLEVSHAIWANAGARFVDDLDYALTQGDAAAWIAVGLSDAESFQGELSGTVGHLACGQAKTLCPGDNDIVMAIVQGTTALDVALAHAVHRKLALQ